jgi:hypothetical protein
MNQSESQNYTNSVFSSVLFISHLKDLSPLICNNLFHLLHMYTTSGLVCITGLSLENFCYISAFSQ